MGWPTGHIVRSKGQGQPYKKGVRCTLSDSVRFAEHTPSFMPSKEEVDSINRVASLRQITTKRRKQ